MIKSKAWASTQIQLEPDEIKKRGEPYVRNSISIRVKFLLLICVLTAGAYATSEFVWKPVPDISLERNYKQADFVAVVSKVESIEEGHRAGYS